MEIIRPKQTRREYLEVELDEARWKAEPGDYLLIERAGSGTTCVLGRFEEVYEGTSIRGKGNGGVKLEIPAFRLRIHNVLGVDFPTINQFNTEHDTRRNFATIENISVGPKQIAARLPIIHPAYEAYIPLVKSLK